MRRTHDSPVEYQTFSLTSIRDYVIRARARYMYDTTAVILRIEL